MSRRQKRTATRVAAWWRDRYAEADGIPSEMAAVRWNRVRADVNDRHPAVRTAAWGRVITRLDALIDELSSLTDSDIAGKEISIYPAHRG
jgi:hypothetical protein